MSTRLQARPTVYKGIKMRSRLEAACAQWIDTCGHPWRYEPQCFADETGQYLPDFLVTLPPDLYVEVKPESILSDRAALADALRRMEIIWSTEPDAVLGLSIGRQYPVVFDIEFSADGAGDRHWRVKSPNVPIPVLWDRRA